MKAAKESGFTLIELMIVIAIIGILAAVAIPAYQDYIGRSQMSEPLNLMGAAKNGLAEQYTNNATWPTNLSDIVSTTSGRYTGGMVGAATGATYTITATMLSSGVNAQIVSKTVGLKTTDGGQSWACGPTGASAVGFKYLPASCRDTSL